MKTQPLPTFPAGDYIIIDPCQLKIAGDANVWHDEVVDRVGHRKPTVWTRISPLALVFHTNCGDGNHRVVAGTDEVGHVFVDSGLIMVAPVASVPITKSMKGKYAVVKCSGGQAEYKNGDLRVGNVTVQTGGGFTK